MKKGISLILLVITIVIMVILATVVILSMSINNPVEGANETVFKSAIDAYKSELKLALIDKYDNKPMYDITEFDAGTWDGNDANITGTIKQYIPSITALDALKYEIQDGKLIFVGTNSKEQEWASELKVGLRHLGINVFATINMTINGEPATYSNPIIPKGFKAINDGATWPTNWNDGLVIEDVSGNQFVWVPVDGTNVTYTKWCTVGTAFNQATIGEDTMPTGVISEIDQITKYGGFYIARYEAGKEGTDTLVHKKNATVWNFVDYTTSRNEATSMYNTAEVKSGLPTGAQWDTTMKWIQNSGKNISNSSAWGNYINSSSPANITGFGVKQTSGYSEYWKAKNIYDLAGNLWEWTNESVAILNPGMFMHRGGCFGNDRAAAYRCQGGYITDSDVLTGFRTVLYIN